MSGFQVYAEPCAECLLSPNRIVSGSRAADILRTCRQEQRHFICHKASIRDEDVCCRRFYDQIGPEINIVRIAQRLRVVRFVPLPVEEDA